MVPQPASSADEVNGLRRCINDLVSILALPATWTGNQRSRIVGDLLDALLSMLDLDFVYAGLRDKADQHSEILRTSPTSGITMRSQELGEIVQPWLENGSQTWPHVARATFDGQELSVVSLPLGLHGEMGTIVAASRRINFPQQTEALILNVAANQAVIGLREMNVLSALDQRVAERTQELVVANEALREAHSRITRSEELWRSVFHNSAIGVALAESNSRLIATNPVFQKMLGYAEHELRNMSFLDVTVEEDRAPNHALVKELLQGKRQQFQIEKRYRRKDGSLVWARTSVSLVPGSELVPQFLMALSEDVTDRKRAEEELRRSENFLATAQRLSQSGSFSWNVDTNEVVFSDEAYRIFAFDRDLSLTLEMIDSRVHPEDRHLLSQKREAADADGEGQDYQIRLLMPDGSVKYLHTTSSEVRDANGRRQYIGALQDVTQRRLAEGALNKARAELAHVSRITALSTLTASIAHEINQPLSGIITNAGTCLRMLDANPPNLVGARETARRTIRDGNRASDVITRLRALFSKTYAEFVPFDLNEAAKDVITLTMSELQRNMVIVQSDFAEDLPAAFGDRVQIQQVILNLVRNASDAMSAIDNRPRVLLIKTESVESGEVRLSVKDSGTGIDPEIEDKLFEAFHTTKEDGMGIGLSISRSIMESHNGRLRAIPNDGPGATFLLCMPCGTDT